MFDGEKFDARNGEEIRSPAPTHQSIDEGGSNTVTFSKTMVFVGSKGNRSDEALKSWIDRALAFTKTLPPK